MMYDDYIKKLNEKFENRLRDISADYNFDYGDEFEIAICHILRAFLPEKYGVCRGVVVDRDGNKEGDDIVIYDKIKHPTINLYNEDYSRKENIPIEAVYAYIEAKHTITLTQFDKALEQVKKIKRICSKREKVGLYQSDPYIGKYEDKGSIVESLPKYRNPIITIILGRYSVDKNDKKTDNPDLVQEMAYAKMANMEKSHLNPEMIILGNKNAMCVGYNSNGSSIPTLFYPDNGKVVGYQNLKLQDNSFGIFMTQLIAAIDWIKLGNIPWIKMLNEAKLNQ
ncbi:hypothetical protein DMA11_18550 [Marinilabiliaceae bacterium JC017]|nr:hypothetical protein DMA11_18550 [Marinilabiliaceae bacterium JC017]